MSKRAIVSSEGMVSEIVEAGDEFEIYEGPDATLKWVDVPDDIDLEKMEFPMMSNGEFLEGHVYDEKVYLETERVHAYGSIGEQLDMQYRDKINGTSEWEDHVAKVKKDNPKPSTGNDPIPRPVPRPEPHWEKI